MRVSIEILDEDLDRIILNDLKEQLSATDNRELEEALAKVIEHYGG